MPERFIEIGKLLARMDSLEKSNTCILKIIEDDHFQRTQFMEMMKEVLNTQTDIKTDLAGLVKNVATINRIDDARKNAAIGFIAAGTIFGSIIIVVFYSILDSLGIPHK